MRITPFIIFDRLTQSLSRTLSEYYARNTRLATGKKINSPSDDPAGLMRAMDYKVSVSADNQYQRNIDTIKNSISITSSIISSVHDTVTNVNKLIATYASGAVNQDPATQAQTMADGNAAASWRDTLCDLANTKALNQYLFAGFKSDQPPYADGSAAVPYDYRGDAGVVKVPVNAAGATVPINVSGSEVFSYTGALPSKQLGNGQWAHYTQGPGNTTTVVINDSTDTVQQDAFSYSNAMQMTDVLSRAIRDTVSTDAAVSGRATARVQALVDPFNRLQEQIEAVQSGLAVRIAGLKDQSDILIQNKNTLQNVISSIEDADPVETAAQLKQTEVTLQALRDSASRVLSQSLFDFLK